jgi:ATP-dependent RNA helicase DeaD
MLKGDHAATLGPLASALEAKGFEQLTPVQEAVLDPALDGRDLRISSQTGSGKTVAIGLALRDLVARSEAGEEDEDEDERQDRRAARPRVIVITPVRELARQVEEELGWLYKPVRARVVSVTGGTSYRDELRALKAQPTVVVGTPGRLRDHLDRKSIDPSQVRAVVLDEADRMLDMGFREEIEAILSSTPEGRRTHLVSATFPREVKRLADKFQSEPAMVEGTPLGSANLDIEHIIHLVQPNERLHAIVNLLLATPGAQTLVFARTRADVAEIADHLGEAGFLIGMLSGEMEQAERNRALGAFKSGRLDALVATDVAARGIDVQDVSRVIHAEPPTDPDAYTHRSGRTGRAGKKGTSSVLVRPAELGKTQRLLERARVRYRFEGVPSADDIKNARDEHLLAALTADDADDAAAPDERDLALAARLADSADPARVIARLIARTRRGGVEPREISAIEPPRPRAERPRAERPERERPERAPRTETERSGGPGGFVPFRVSWGRAHGADARRLVAMLCRRGGIDGRAIGAIKVGPTYSLVEVSSVVAEAFERATKDVDPRDPRVMIRRYNDGPPPARADRPARPERTERAERTERTERPERSERPGRPPHAPVRKGDGAARPKRRPH